MTVDEAPDLMPAETAACFMMLLERRGARFVLRPDGYFEVDFDASDIRPKEAESFMAVLSALADPIRALLKAQRTVN